MDPIDQDTIDTVARSLYVSDHATVEIAGEAFAMMLKVNPGDQTVQDYRRRARVAISTYRGTQRQS